MPQRLASSRPAARRTRLALGAAILAAGTMLTGSAPALAQYAFPPRSAPVPHYGPIPPHEIAERMMRRGFLEIDPPQMRGDIYVVTGIDARGERVRLVLDAYDGSMLERRSERVLANAPTIAPPPRIYVPDVHVPSVNVPPMNVPHVGAPPALIPPAIVPRAAVPEPYAAPYQRPPRVGAYGANREIEVLESEEEMTPRSEPPRRRVSRAEPPAPRKLAPRGAPVPPAPPAKVEASKFEASKPEAAKPEAAKPEAVTAEPRRPEPTTTASVPDIRLAEPPAAPPVSVPPAETGASRPVRVIGGVTGVPADAAQKPE